MSTKQTVKLVFADFTFFHTEIPSPPAMFILTKHRGKRCAMICGESNGETVYFQNDNYLDGELRRLRLYTATSHRLKPMPPSPTSTPSNKRKTRRYDTRR